jgi:putative transcriptional regulator
VVGVVLGLTALLAARPAAGPAARGQERLHRTDVAALAAGKLLVSARRLPDSNFSRTVILLADVNDQGAFGLVVNRRSDLTLARVFPNLKVTAGSGERAFLGGPVETTRALVLVRGVDAPPKARPVGGGVFLVTGDGVEPLVTSGAPSTRLRVYLGYAGWAPGQLQAETEEGAWHVLEGGTDVVFDPDPAGMWQRQIARTEVIQASRAPSATPEVDPACSAGRDPQAGRTATAAMACHARSASSGASRATMRGQSWAATSSGVMRLAVNAP